MGSPFLGIAEYERAHRLPHNYINCLMYSTPLVAMKRVVLTPMGRFTLYRTAYGNDGAYQRYERGEINLKQFYDAWGRELNNVERGNKAYKTYCAKRSLSKAIYTECGAVR